MCTKGICRPSIGRYSRPICRPSIGRHVVRVNRPSVNTIGRYVGRHSADISADMSLEYRSTVGGIGVLLTVVLLK